MRQYLVGALAIVLAGCSHQPPPSQMVSCTSANGSGCVAPARKLASSDRDVVPSKSARATSPHRRAIAASSSVRNRHPAHLAHKAAKQQAFDAKAALPDESVTRESDAPATRPPSTGAASEAPNAPSADIAQEPSAASAKAWNAMLIEAQVSAARAFAERVTAPVATPRAADKENAGPADEARIAALASDRLVAVLMARPEVTSVSDLKGKAIAIDDKYAVSDALVRTAIVAAGAPEVQLSQGQTTAINRLSNGEVQAAVLALLTPEAAERFPVIAGFRIFHVPLSPAGSKPRS